MNFGERPHGCRVSVAADLVPRSQICVRPMQHVMDRAGASTRRANHALAAIELGRCDLPRTLTLLYFQTNGYQASVHAARLPSIIDIAIIASIFYARQGSNFRSRPRKPLATPA